MGTTRATSGPVRCPWCARPVSDGPDHPDVCPSCGVPLAHTPAEVIPPVPAMVRRHRARRAQRLRAVAAVLGLTSLVMAIAAVAAAPALLASHGDNQPARDNVITVLRAAEQIKKATGEFTGAQPVVLQAKIVRGIVVVDHETASTRAGEVSMFSDAQGWYGAVRAESGPCLAAASISGRPTIVETVLPGNCTGDAAHATMAPLPQPAATITPATQSGSVPSRAQAAG